MKLRNSLLALVAVLALARGAVAEPASAPVVRIGHFPNISHAPALVAHNFSRTGEGFIEKRLGAGARIEWYAYNAGPSAMEALLLGSIDAAFVGPSPAINAHLRTKGEEVRVLGGSTRGGAALVLASNSGISKPADFKGKRIATPQLGNTQDIAARLWLKQNGFRITQTGGDVLVLPTENPEQLTLMLNGQIDGAWTVEPWVTRIEREAGGRIYLLDQDSLTTILVVSAKFMRSSPETVTLLRGANRELVAWVNQNADEAQSRVRAELEALTSRPVGADLVAAAWGRMRFESDIALEQLQSFVESAKQVGFLKGAGNISGMFDVSAN